MCAHDESRERLTRERANYFEALARVATVKALMAQSQRKLTLLEELLRLEGIPSGEIVTTTSRAGA